MKYVPTNDDVNTLSDQCLTLCTALVCKTHPLLDVGSRTSVTLAAMTTGVTSIAIFAMALNEIAGDGITISRDELVELVNALVHRPDYVERVKILHGKLKRAIGEVTLLPEIKVHDKQPDN